MDAPAVTVDVLIRSGHGSDTWEAGNAEWATAQPSKGAVTVAQIVHGGSRRFGPFEWLPRTAGRHAVFVRSTSMGDRSNADSGSALRCAAGPIRMRDLVPFDNNLGFRTWLLS